MKNPIFEYSFWKIRYDEARKIGNLSHAIGQGFNFGEIDQIHKQIIERENLTGKILDFGCGYGRTSRWFSDEGYVGVDFMPEFINEAKVRFPNKKFIIADLRSLPFEDATFDWGVGVSIKEMIRRDAGEDIWYTIQKELKRVCKKLLILEYGNNRPEEIWKYEII